MRKYQYANYTEPSGTKAIVAITHYNGKPIRGVAKCDPADSYDEAAGRKLAEARCELKYAKARKAKAMALNEKAKKAMLEAINEYNKTYEFLNDTLSQYFDAQDNLEVIVKSFREK